HFAQARAEATDLDALACLPHDAVLVIGDAALVLKARQAYPHRYDLGEEWRRWTGLPFVFAVWAARREADPAAVRLLHAALLASRTWGLAHLPALAADAHAAPGVPRHPRAVPARIPARAGAAGRRRAVAVPPRKRRHLHRRPEHQLHQRVRRGLQVLRVLPAAQAPRGVRALVRGDRPEDRRGEGPGRRPDPDAGRPQPLHPVPVVPRPVALHQAAPPDPHPRLLAVRDRLLRRALRDDDRRGDPRAGRG